MGCCQLVGDLDIGVEGLVSVSINSNTEATKIGGNLIVGPTTGSVSISGYAKDTIHTGCPGKAGVQVPWLRKWDCDNDELYFISCGAGKSFVSGDISGLASLKETIPNGTYEMMSASSSSGPASIYMTTTQTDGYGLSYSGNPIGFGSSEGFVLSGLGIGVGILYLQSFSLECSPGAVPIASYSFVFVEMLGG